MTPVPGDISLSDLLRLSPIVLIAYLIIRDLIPKIWPDIVKVWSSKVSTEEHLFKLLEQSNKANQDLAASLAHLGVTLDKIDERLERVELVLNDKTMKAFYNWISSMPPSK